MQYFDALRTIVQTYLPQKQIAIIEEAYVYARNAHEGQLRSSGEPYVTHPIAVACILAEMHLDYETITAALLHDVIEDTPVTYEDITHKFGYNIAELVEGVSKLDKLKFRNRKEAQAENFRKMVMAMVQDVRVILIKLADRTHNMRTLDSLRPDKRRRIAKETLEIYAPLAHRLGIHHLRMELEVLGFTALYPNRANVINKVVQAARGTRKDMIQRILTEMRNRLAQLNIDGIVEGIEKNIYAIYQKMQLREQRFHSIMDIYVFRIIVKDIDTCYRVLGVMHNLYKPKVGRFKDYIAIPKVNGYQSLHSSMIGPHGVPIEVQIRTEDMEKMAELGIAAHWADSKDSESTKAQIKAQHWMQNLLELQQSVGNSFEFIENVKSDLFPHEIYVFTPKGRIVELPKGATPIDFAYTVHTDVGNRCVGAIVDRKPYPLSQPLSSGQTVEIITSATAHPNAAWLDFVVSSKARARIRQTLKTLKREEAITLGYKLLDYALTTDNGLANIPAKNIEYILKITKLATIDDLLAEIGLGNIMSIFVAKGLERGQEIQADLAEKKTLTISGTEGVLVTLSKCCYPIPGDPIIGHISPEKGLMIHHESCSNISGYQNSPEKYIPTAWAENLEQQLFIAELKVDILNYQGALATIISSINDESANVQRINTEDKDGRTYTVMVLLEVKNSQHLNDVIRRLSHQSNIVSVTRKIN